MRITNSMMTNGFMRNLNRNLTNFNRLNEQLTSGKEISKPSDNPFKVARSMQLHSDIQANEQYNTNIVDTINHLETTDTALEQFTNVMQRVRELTVSAGNAAYGSDERSAIKDEINEKVSEMAQILNTSFDGKYVFGGTKTSTKPLVDRVNPETGNKELFYADKEGNPIDVNSQDQDMINQFGMIDSKLTVEISQGVHVDYNVNASEVLEFKDSEGNSKSIMSLFNDIITNLDSDKTEDTSKLTGENLQGLDDVITNLLSVRAEVGAMQNRMDSAKTQNEDENFNMTQILSKNEDIDFAEKTMEVTVAQTVYTAALQTSAKIMQPTLMDYLR